MSRGTFCGRLKFVFRKRPFGSTSTRLSGFEWAFSRLRATLAPTLIAVLALAQHAFYGPLLPLVFPCFGGLLHDAPRVISRCIPADRADTLVGVDCYFFHDAFDGLLVPVFE